MMTHIHKFTGRVREKALFMLLFGIFFVSVGYYVPRFYFRYLDRTEYFRVFSPVAVDKSVYNPCDDVLVTIRQNSLVNGRGTANIALNLIREVDGVKERIGYQTRDIPINIGEDLLDTHWKVACEATPGQYMFEGTLTYYVNDLEKHTPFYSTKFLVIDKDSKPSEIKEVIESVQESEK